MKFKNAKSGHYESGPNMTPLVDVVMVILIFMMLAGTFGAASHFMPWTMSGGDSTHRHSAAPMMTRLDVFVSSPSDDTFRARLSGGEVFTDSDSLRGALDARRRTHEASGTAGDKLEIMINPRLTTRYQHLAAVYEAAMGAGWGKIGFRPARE